MDDSNNGNENWDPVLFGDSEEFFVYAMERVEHQLAYAAKYEELERMDGGEDASRKKFLVREKDAATNTLWVASYFEIGGRNKRYLEKWAAREQQLIALSN